MKANKKAKWIIGITGTAFSAFVLGQINDSEAANQEIPKVEMSQTMSEQEKELVKLDWSNFSVQTQNSERNKQNDRTTRRT